MEVKINKASLDDLRQLSQLFDSYRVFYKNESDLEGALHFMSERLKNQDSIIFLAKNKNGDYIGFTQLYPTFSSQSMQRVFILNDLYVSESYRELGVASLLIQKAKEQATRSKAKALMLCTQHTNLKAQALYKKVGFQPLNDYQWYQLLVNS